MKDKTLFIDCFSGVSGDMFVAALLDSGVGSLELLRDELHKMPIEGWDIKLEVVRPSGIAATRFNVRVVGEKQKPRSLSDIHDLISASKLSESVKSSSLAIFSRVGRAEAEAHGQTLETVHFHEVGMVDSIIDIVGACILMDELAPKEIVCSPVEMGSGMVDTKHGPMPVPAPAAAILLKGAPVMQGVEECELTTPTGAALVTYFADRYGPMPPMEIEEVGYGSGTHETKQRPDLLRFVIGKSSGAGVAEEIEQMALIESNIDDSTAEELAHLAEKLMEAGANDVWLTPIIMKKGRPGVTVSVLCPQGDIENYTDIIFSESSTFGVRVSHLERHCLERHMETVSTQYGDIQVKVGLLRGRVMSASPEYEDCRRAAAEHGVALQIIYDAATAAAGEKI
jgi:hypothetical protein